MSCTASRSRSAGIVSPFPDAGPVAGRDTGLPERPAPHCRAGDAVRDLATPSRRRTTGMGTGQLKNNHGLRERHAFCCAQAHDQYSPISTPRRCCRTLVSGRGGSRRSRLPGACREARRYSHPDRSGDLLPRRQERAEPVVLTTDAQRRAIPGLKWFRDSYNHPAWRGSSPSRPAASPTCSSGRSRRLRRAPGSPRLARLSTTRRASACRRCGCSRTPRCSRCSSSSDTRRPS